MMIHQRGFNPYAIIRFDRRKRKPNIFTVIKILYGSSIDGLKKELLDFLLEQTINYKNKKNIKIDEKILLNYAQNLGSEMAAEFFEAKK